MPLASLLVPSPSYHPVVGVACPIWQAYSAVVFNDCLPNGEEDPRTLHGGSPPSNYTKIAINIWIRAQARSDPNAAWL